MPLISRSSACFVAVLSLCVASRAHAQRVDDGSDRFFTNKVEAKAEQGDKKPVVQGSVTSTTFVYSEFGGATQGYNPDYIDNYSPENRLFTDIRTRLDAKHLGGGTWNLHLDARVRVSPGCRYQSLDDPDLANLNNVVQDNCQVQSGTLGGNEYDAREIYAKRTGEKTDISIGRQYIYELAATKIDGVRVQYRTTKTWDLLGFAGLNPAKFSRSVLDDYPAATLVDGTPAGGRILPVAAGLGAGYRSRNVYGSLGAVGVLPLADDRATGANEALRLFLTDTGYWRQSGKLDFFHYLVVDLQSAAGFGVTNASVGANFRPIPAMTINASVNRVDTETLNSIAQTEIFEPNPDAVATPYNYQEVLRVASDSARLGVSVALAEQRFEISTSGQVRQREEITLSSTDNAVTYIIPATRNAEVTLAVRDRRSLGGLRLGASFTAIFPFANDTPNRSNAKIARLTGSRMLLDERAEFEFNLTYLTSDDLRTAGNCIVDPIDTTLPMNPLDCYGQADVMAFSAGGLLYYRFARNWFGIGSASLGYQSLTDIINGAPVTQPANLSVSGFGRLAYRF